MDSWARHWPRLAAAFAAWLAALGLAAACGGGSGPEPQTCPSGRLAVVAAENFWGSVARQVGGERACVTSIVSNPDTDPHDYDASPRDARLIARASYVIVNGAGYDPWAPRLLAANPAPGRKTLDVGALVGVKEGGNPHLWYSPEYVDQVVDRITADYKSLDPAGSGYFEEAGARFKSAGLKHYRDTIAAIRQRYSGVAVGASESVFVYLAEATGLNLVTPPGYMKAISEGTDPTAADKATVDRQVGTRQIKVFVYNAQNSTPDVKNVVDKARRANIPVVQVTETLTPAGASFQDWQAGQLESLLKALGS